VSKTETVAHHMDTAQGSFGHRYSLNGFKWFSSATDSNIALALARTNTLDETSRGLSLFVVPLRLPLFPQPSEPLPSPTSNSIFLHRLKNKIGTHILPTAELSLQGTQGYLIGELGKGVPNIASVLNITRVWSAISGAGGLRKCLNIATEYAKVRAVQGGRLMLTDAPLHVSQLASANLMYRALVHLTFGTIRLLGKVECNTATPSEARLLRLLTPVTKAFVAEKACTAMEECMSMLGGAGYMEENEIGRMIRDCLVEKYGRFNHPLTILTSLFRIWEGTTTVMALDVVRAAKDSLTVNDFIFVGAHPTLHPLWLS
jgi:alkylation response protein AidB-like acyl-CoA dehydrogenase